MNCCKMIWRNSYHFVNEYSNLNDVFIIDKIYILKDKILKNIVSKSKIIKNIKIDTIKNI